MRSSRRCRHAASGPSPRPSSSPVSGAPRWHRMSWSPGSRSRRHAAGAAIAIELDGDTRDGDTRDGDTRDGGTRDGGTGPEGRGARVSRCRIGLFGLGPTPLRARAAEAAVTGSPAGDVSTEARAREIGQAAVADLESVRSDLHGPAAYRKRVGAALVAVAWQRAISEALD